MSRTLASLFLILLSLLYTSNAMAKNAEEKKKPAEPILLEKGGVLLPSGTFVIEPGLQYSHFSRHRISISGFTILDALIIGELSVSDIKRDIIQPYLTARLGITNRFEMEAKVPYVYRYDREIKGPGTTEESETTVDGYGLGDIEGAFAYHLIMARDSMPDVVVNLRVKSHTGRSPYSLDKDEQGKVKELPTGNGHLGVSGGLTIVKVNDPAVFFASAGYYWNVKKDFENVGTIDPGDSVEYSMGIAYALSEKLSLSTSYQQRFTAKTTHNDKKLAGTFVNSASIFFGGSYALSKRSNLNVSIGTGLTLDAPDVQVTVSLPIRF